MRKKLHLQDVFEGNRVQKVVLIVSVLLFLVIELLIYMTSASQAGQKSRIIVADMNGKKVFETSGTALTSYEKLMFENNFGPLTNYQIHLETESLPFPFRAWLTASVGIPVGLILLIAFLVKAYLSLLYSDEKEEKPPESTLDTPPPIKEGKLGAIFHSVGKVTIFHIGFAVLIAVLLLWMVPNFLGDFFRISTETVREYKWFFGGVVVFLAFIITWVIYLRYKLSKQMLDNQFNLEKFRMEQQLLIQQDTPVLLPKPDDSPEQARET